MKTLLCLVGALICASAQGAVETYKIDPVHSSVGFTVRHFFTKVPGQFTKFEGTISVDRDNLEKSSTEATIQVGSVDTRNERRDSDLKSGNYFAADQFPTISFKSTKWAKTGEDTFDITGDLTIKGVTHPVVLHAKSLGFGAGMRNTMLSGWEGTTKIDRRDFGMKLNPAMEKVLGSDVDISITVEADLQK
jgi:polyisoprenoid-binding protein YceI